MTRILMIASMLAIMASPARAVCDNFAKAHQLYVAEVNAVTGELARVKAIKPAPRNDAALCGALRKALRDTPFIIVNADRSCFQTDQQLRDFKKHADDYGKSAATLVAFYCSEAELKQPLPPLFDGKF